MTKVKFLLEQTAQGLMPFAYFPGLVFSDGFMTSYSRMGQHSGCSAQYVKGKREAQYNQYQPLLKELIGQGYNDLLILNKQEFEYHRPPTTGEIKFGEGATHYRSFTLAEIGITKTGDLKRWFVADDDKLRYTR